MKRIDNRQYKLTRIRRKKFSVSGIKIKKGKRRNSRLDRRTG